MKFPCTLALIMFAWLGAGETLAPFFERPLNLLLGAILIGALIKILATDEKTAHAASKQD